VETACSRERNHRPAGRPEAQGGAQLLGSEHGEEEEAHLLSFPRELYPRTKALIGRRGNFNLKA